MAAGSSSPAATRPTWGTRWRCWPRRPDPAAARAPCAESRNRTPHAGHSRNVPTDWRSASDQELWSLAADQQAGPAFGELFERHADRVYAHCFQRTGSWSMAEDLTSAVFLAAWRRRRGAPFTGDPVRPWRPAGPNT